MKHTFNPSSWEVESDQMSVSLNLIPRQPELHKETLSQKGRAGRKTGFEGERVEKVDIWSLEYFSECF